MVWLLQCQSVRSYTCRWLALQGQMWYIHTNVKIHPYKCDKSLRKDATRNPAISRPLRQYECTEIINHYGYFFIAQYERCREFFFWIQFYLGYISILFLLRERMLTQFRTCQFKWCWFMSILLYVSKICFHRVQQPPSCGRRNLMKHTHCLK